MPTQKKLSFVMATYADPKGVWMTIQSFLKHCVPFFPPHWSYEIRIFDNFGDPNSDGLKKGGELNKSIGDPTTYEYWYSVRSREVFYHHYTEIRGTAAPRDAAIRASLGEYFLCTDCHVLYDAESILSLLAYFDEFPDTPDLLQGPMQYDWLDHVDTQFDDRWRDKMWGTFGQHAKLLAAGKPFDIPSQGLGCFAGKVSNWPGFNEHFRGFGGEEGYIHEKYRQRGGRTLCIPQFVWDHCYHRPGGTKYRNVMSDRITNYLIGHAELGLPQGRIVRHFQDGFRDYLIKAIEHASKRCDNMTVHYENGEFVIDSEEPRAAHVAGEPETIYIGKSAHVLEKVHTQDFSNWPKGGLLQHYTHPLKHHAKTWPSPLAVSVQDAVTHEVKPMAGWPKPTMVDFDTRLQDDAELREAKITEQALRLEAAGHKVWIPHDDEPAKSREEERPAQRIRPQVTPGQITPLTESVKAKLAEAGLSTEAPVIQGRAPHVMAAKKTEAVRPFVSCLMPTFNRYPNRAWLVEEAVESFLRQDYPESQRELIILNDTPGQVLEFEHPQVRVINTQQRFSTLSEKIRAMIAACNKQTQLYARWDDDDVSLPWRLTYSVDKLADGLYWRPQHHWYDTGTLSLETPACGHNMAIFSRKLLTKMAGGYPQGHSGTEDIAFETAMFQAGAPQSIISHIPPTSVFYLYRWRHGGTHLSAVPVTNTSGEEQDPVALGHKKYASIGRQEIQQGTFTIEPRWHYNHVARTQQAIRISKRQDKGTEEDISGSVEHLKLIDLSIKLAPPNARFAEIGPGYGRGVIHAAQEAKKAGKRIRVYAIGQGNHVGNDDIQDFDQMKHVMDWAWRCGVSDVVTVVGGDSVETAADYEDGAFSFVFIAGRYSYDDMLSDIQAWWPKVRENGLLAGTGLKSPETVRAVCTFFKITPEDVRITDAPGCWGMTK